MERKLTLHQIWRSRIPKRAGKDTLGSAIGLRLSVHHIWIPIARETLSGSFSMSYLILNFRNHFRGRRSSPLDSAIRHYSTPTKGDARANGFESTPLLHGARRTAHGARRTGSVRGTEQYAHGAAINQRVQFREAGRSWIALSTRPDSQP